MGEFRDAMDQEMALRGLSERTREMYLSWVRRLIQFSRVVPDQITTEQIREYLLHLTEGRHVAFGTFNQALSAIRFFFTVVLKQPWQLEGFYSQRPPQRLPVVLNDEEVLAILDATSSLRDRALLELGYAAGLRVSEVTGLRITDIDSQRMAIRVEQGKGRKDRYVMLSESLLETLRAYWRQYKPRVFLFPGLGGKKPLDVTVAQRAFGQARDRAGIKKRVSFHTLRHSFATHVLEDGGNVRKIQALLGHRSLRTTERYMHLTASYLHELRSPLDRLRKKEPTPRK